MSKIRTLNALLPSLLLIGCGAGTGAHATVAQHEEPPLAEPEPGRADRARLGTQMRRASEEPPVAEPERTRRPDWISDQPARRISIRSEGAHILLEDGTVWFWANARARVEAWEAPPGPIPGASGLVDYCWPWGVYEDGTMGQTMSSGRYHTSSGESGVLSCAFDPPMLCLLDRSGGVRCRSGHRETPAHVSDRRDFVRVSIEARRACALTEGGELHCWSREEPRARRVFDGVSTFALGRLGVCAVRTDHSLWCNPRETRRPFEPDPASGQPGFASMQVSGGVRDVALAGWGGIVMMDDGRAIGWGRHEGFWNSRGPAEVPWLRGARTVSIRRYSVCAILQDGRAACWNPQGGEIGTGSA